MARSATASAALALLLMAVACEGSPRNCSAVAAGNGEVSEEIEQSLRLISKEYIQPLAFAFLLTLVVATILEKAHVRFLPESLVVIMVGAALGFGLQAMSSFPTEILHHLSAPVVNLIFLPLIIFESGWNLRQKDFAAQFAYILIFAVIGTFISMLVCGALIHATGHIHGITDRRTAYTFASLISATDPVATLATYSSLKVDPLLNIMVFGESTVNDAVAIVVFDILNGEEIYGSPCEVSFADGPSTLGAICLGIVKKLAGSVIVGMALAFVYTLVLRCANMQHSTSMEILFIVFSCYFTFSTAEQVHMSGIIAVLFCGIMMGIYTKRHLSKEGKVLASFFIKELAAWADMGIFLLVGVNMVLTTGTSWRFSGWIMLFLLVARAAAVLPCGLAVNGLKRFFGRRESQQPLLLSGRHMFMMWHAGLRGGIALVLCLEMGEWVDIRGGEGTKQTLINTTITIIVIFLLIFGGTTECALSKLRIPMGVDADERFLYDRSLLTCTHTCFAAIDKKVLKPVLVGRGHGAEALPEEEQVGQATPTPEGKLEGHLHHRKLLARGNTWFSSKQGKAARAVTEDLDSSEDSETSSSGE